jgi:hypothetical protein
VCYALALHPTTLVPAGMLRARLRQHFEFIIADDAVRSVTGRG